MIRTSTTEVGSGVRLVREAGEALQTIQQYVVSINQHMDAIATSTREQSVGLGEVNSAVNQMDQVTQQNAAMVEETSAASATLARESRRLRELVAQFKLRHGPVLVTGRHACPSEDRPKPRQMQARVASAFSANAAYAQESWHEFSIEDGASAGPRPEGSRGSPWTRNVFGSASPGREPFLPNDANGLTEATPVIAQQRG